MTCLVQHYEAMTQQETGPAAVCEYYRQNYTRLFITALLLTGSSARAERAIEQSVNLLDVDGAPGERGILIAVVRAALAGRRLPAAEHSDGGLQAKELRAVLRLDPDLRCCFVLRRLAGFTAAQTAGLLLLGASDVDALTRAAILRLVDIAGGIQ